jgi:hypothetical protein
MQANAEAEGQSIGAQEAVEKAVILGVRCVRLCFAAKYGRGRDLWKGPLTTVTVVHGVCLRLPRCVSTGPVVARLAVVAIDVNVNLNLLSGHETTQET